MFIPDENVGLIDTNGVIKKVEQGQGLISILEEIQAKYGYLPEKSLRDISEYTGRSLVDIYGVVTFYKSFGLQPRGKHLIYACLGTACHVRNAPVIAEELEHQLGIRAGETTSDKAFTLETVNCLGACALGPIVVIDGHYFSNVRATEIKSILEAARNGLDTVEVESDKRIFPVEVSCSQCNHSLMDQNRLIDGYPSIRVSISFRNKHGWLALSSLYGSYNVDSQYEIPFDTVVQYFCPHCHAELIGASDCPECSAKMVPMIVRGGGNLQICSRRGCRYHLLVLSGAMVD